MSLCRQSLALLRRCAVLNLYKTNTIQTREIKRWVSPTLKELLRRREKIGPEPEKPRSNFLEWNYEAELFAFGERLGEKFDRGLLKQSLRQREYANLQEFHAQEKGETLADNAHNYELIEEGAHIISSYIKTQYGKIYPSEIVEAVCNHLMSDDMMSHIGTHIGLKDIIITNEFPVEKRTISNTFKAVVSALKRSTDLSRAENFVKDFVLSQMYGKDVYEIWDVKQPYEYLQKVLEKNGVTEIEPRLCNESAANTILACFQVGLYNNKKLLGIGWGESIDIAKDSAAVDAIKRLFDNQRRQKQAPQI